MKYKQIENKFIMRIDKNEEIIAQIKKLCLLENITVGTISGIGAVNNVTIGLFNTTTKKYQSKTFKDDFEITSFIGNISTMDNEVYIHAHISISDSNYIVRGGHLNSGIISATGEFIIESFDSIIDREYNEEIKLNLYKLD